jgi:O-antigen/teichoic acid export membrane protein
MASSPRLSSWQRLQHSFNVADGGLISRVFTSSVWVSVSYACQTVLQFGRQIVLARLLTPDAFGTMGLCLVVTRGLELFTTTGIGPALIQRRDNVDAAKPTAFTLQAGRGVILGLLTVLISPLAAWYYDAPRLTALISTLAVVFVINGLVNVETILLNKRLEFRTLTALDLWSAVIGSASLVAFAFALRSVWAVIFGNIVTALTRTVLSFLLIRTRPGFGYDGRIAREFAGYGRFVTASTAVIFVASEIDNVFVGKMLSFEALGFYSVAFTLANLPATSISRTAMLVIFPAYAALQAEPEKLRAGYLTVLRTVGAISLAAAAGLATLAPDVIRIVYSPRWLPAVGALQILSLLGAARAVSILSGYVYNAIGKPWLSFYLVAGRLVLIVPLLYPLIRAYGIVGAAIAMAVPQALELVAGLWVLQREIGVPVKASGGIIFRQLLNVAAMVAVLIAGRWLLDPVGPLGLLGLVIAGTITFGLVSFDQIALVRSALTGAAPRAGGSAG